MNICKKSLLATIIFASNPAFSEEILFQGGQRGINFQETGQFQQTLPVQQTTLPKTPPELGQGKSDWQNFNTKLQFDPTIMQAALLTATQILSGAGQGESVAGALGRAMQTGVLAHGFLQGNQAQQEMRQTKLAEQQRVNTSTIDLNRTQTDGLLQQQEFARQSHAAKQARLKNEAAQNQTAFSEDNDYLGEVKRFALRKELQHQTQQQEGTRPVSAKPIYIYSPSGKPQGYIQPDAAGQLHTYSLSGEWTGTVEGKID